MERSNGYILGFTLVLCLITSVTLSLLSKGLEDRKKLNVEIDIKKNILAAFGVDVATATQQEIAEKYKSSVEEYVVNEQGTVVKGRTPASIDPEKEKNLLPVYKYSGENNLYAIPISGYGLWSWMYGYFALDSDLNTVKGITFYKHGETPGLGGEIEAQWFRDNFIGKKISDPSGKLVSIKVAKSKATDVTKDPEKLSHIVDGISGATITSNGVTKTLIDWLTKYEPHFKTLRTGGK